MRTLHVITSADPAHGGPIEGLRRLDEALTRMGHAVEVVSLDAPDATWVPQLLPLRLHTIGSGRSGYGYCRQLIPWIRSNADRFDAVVVQGLWQYPGLATARALDRTDIPYYVFPHGMLDPWFKQAYPLKHLKKSLYWLVAESHVLRKARAVLFTCEEERQLAKRSFWPYHCREIVVNFGTSAPDGDPITEKEAFLGRFPNLRTKRMLLFLGRIHTKKGCDLLIDAFATFARASPDLHLVMAGPDPIGWQRKLEERAAQLGVSEQITWTGMLTGALKWGAFRSAEAFILPSHQENFGIAVVEAMACGVPVLISNKINIWREIESDRAGLVAEDTLEGTTRLLADWLRTPVADREAMGRRAASSFVSRYESRKVARSFLSALGVSSDTPACV